MGLANLIHRQDPCRNLVSLRSISIVHARMSILCHGYFRRMFRVFVFNPNYYGFCFSYGFGLSFSFSNMSGLSSVGRHPSFGHMPFLRIIDFPRMLLDCCLLYKFSLPLSLMDAEYLPASSIVLMSSTVQHDFAYNVTGPARNLA